MLYHEVPGKSSPGYEPLPGIHAHCGGYAESVTPDIWGAWDLSPPQCGAYTLDIDGFVGLEPTATAGDVVGGRCAVGALLGCFNDTSCATGKCAQPLLPRYQAQLHDKVTLEACALAVRAHSCDLQLTPCQCTHTTRPVWHPVCTHTTRPVWHPVWYTLLCSVG